MKQYRILKEFKGSQHGGNPVIEFKPGQVVGLSDQLAAMAKAGGWAEEVDEAAAPDDASREAAIAELAGSKTAEELLAQAQELGLKPAKKATAQKLAELIYDAQNPAGE